MTYEMNSSSSLLVALIGGPDCFAAFSPPIARKAPTNVVPRVAIASYNNEEIDQPNPGSVCFMCMSAKEDMARGTYNMRSDLPAGDSVHLNHLCGVGV